MSTLDDRQWPFTLKLKHPFDFGSERISELEFRRGKMGDLRGIGIEGLPTVDQLLLIASRMCNQHVKVMENLADEDGAEVVSIALVFFSRSLVGGGKPSQP